MELDSEQHLPFFNSLTDQKDSEVKSVLNDDWETIDDFWNNIDVWTDTSKIGTGVGAEYYDFVSNHEKMLQECLNFDDWLFDITLDQRSAQPPAGNEINAMAPKWYGAWEGVKYKTRAAMQWDEEKSMFVEKIDPKGWARYFSNPFDHPDSFPTICEWAIKNKHQYVCPVISRLCPKGTIIPHRHNLIKRENRILGRMLYNFCLNFPEGCKFAMHPTGLIPYKAGEIYKLWVHEGMHSVINNSKEDRYHIMLRPSNYKEYVPEVS